MKEIRQLIKCIHNNIQIGKWYNEYSGFEIHDYFNLMVNQVPILTVRKYKDNHSKNIDEIWSVGLLGFSLTFKKI